MRLKAIVAALGGELYQGGSRACVPAPGHSPHDRSISLWLVDGRVLVHSFGGGDWREVRRALEGRGLIDSCGRLMATGGRGDSWTSSPPPMRREVAAALWEGGQRVGTATPAGRYLVRRRVPLGADNLRHHAHVPVSVYRPGPSGRSALLARISDVQDRLTGVEVTYLEPNGLRACGLRLSRKTIGRVPKGAAVRLAPADRRMLVGEGVCTTLSAMARFGRPGWALGSARNLAVWTPPDGVDDILIAADRGEAGEAAALGLYRRLTAMGRRATVVLPPLPHGDWNEAAAVETE